MITAMIFHGFTEATVYDNGYKGGHIEYHIFTILFFALLLTPFFILDPITLKFIPLLPVIQDGSFFIYSVKKLNHESWSNFRLGGNSILGQWIPNTYVIGIVSFIIIIAVFA